MCAKLHCFNLCQIREQPMIQNAMNSRFELSPSPQQSSSRAAAPVIAGLRVGIDLVQISAIAKSIEAFGDHFMRRIFSDDEVAYAKGAPALTAERLAARFAAKEAAMKVFGLSEAGIGWRDIEVRRDADGACSLKLHRKAADIAASLGCARIAVSLSHDGDYATAVVAALG
jgi:holo-[acyl-carrier protein] synthase